MKIGSTKTLYGALLAITVTLSGCGTTKLPAVTTEDKKTIEFDRRLLTECAKLTKPKSGTDTDLNEWAKETINSYTECMTNKSKMNAEVKKAFNLP